MTSPGLRQDSRFPGVRIHGSAHIDPDVTIGSGTVVWHSAHVMSGAVIGRDCVLSQNVMIGSGVQIGDGVRIQNNVAVFEGVELEDDVFCGPGAVFTNVLNPRAAVNRSGKFEVTVVRRGATIGANATIVCGVALGEFAFVGAGAVVTTNVLPYGLVVGVPSRQIGWVGRSGERLTPDLRCPGDGTRYVLRPEGGLDIVDDQP
jgi:UDP-2-acetamido-3-amino-2,3-dideoxy-glucuronate N-acetyltransferase